MTGKEAARLIGGIVYGLPILLAVHAATPASAQLDCTKADIVGNDGKVDQDDLGLLLGQFGLCAGQPGFNSAADLNADGCVNQVDLGILLPCYGWDKCDENLAPVAAPSGPANGTVGTPVQFSSSGSSDWDGQIVAWHWNFGDGTTSTQASPQKTYSAASNYTVTLTVTDDCGATNAKQVQISITQPGDPQPLQADFDVKMFVGGDFGDPSRWQGIGLSQDQPAERGVKLMLDGSLSSGDIVSYRWQIGAGSYFYGMQPIKQLYGSASVTLKVRDADWNEHSVTKTVYIADGLAFMSASSFPGETFAPGLITIAGTDAWMVGGLGDNPGRIAVLDISNPGSLPNAVPMPIVASGATAIAHQGGRLFISRDQAGLNVYNMSKNPGTFGLLKSYAPSAFGASYIKAVAAKGDIVFVATDSPKSLRGYDFSDLDNPQLLWTLPLHARRIAVGDAVLSGHNGNGQFFALDIRTPSAPLIVVSDLYLGQNQSYGITTWGNRVAVGLITQSAFMDFIVPGEPDQPIAVPGVTLMPMATGYAFSDMRLYWLQGNIVSKHDFAWSPLYDMQTAPVVNSFTFALLFDNNANWERPVLLVGTWSGLRAYAP
jgi:PKD repeat protein